MKIKITSLFFGKKLQYGIKFILEIKITTLATIYTCLEILFKLKRDIIGVHSHTFAGLMQWNGVLLGLEKMKPRDLMKTLSKQTSWWLEWHKDMMKWAFMIEVCLVKHEGGPTSIDFLRESEVFD